MSKNVAGLDFGHSRTSMSECHNGQLSSFLIDGKNQYSYSEVAYRPYQATYYFGQDARDHIMDDGISYYKNFKMLLCEHDQNLLRENQYEDVKPKEICQQYLSNYLKKYLTQKKLKQLDKLYVGVPEICYEMGSQIDYRQELKEVLESIVVKGNKAVKEVQVISEPVAAGAYYVVEHDKLYKQHFAGHVLVIDYGAGTLDLTLLKVLNNDHNELSDIIVQKRIGLGENTNHQIGKAANAFYEDILKIALSKISYTKDQHYYYAYQLLENQVIQHKMDIEDIYDDALSGYLTKTAFQKLIDIDDVFMKLSYHNQEVVVTYGMLAQAYFEIIYQDFDHLLDEMIHYMENKHIPYLASVKEAIKIVVTGGFSNFYLVQLQIQNKFGRISHDMRFVNVPDASNAVANGLGYLAGGMICFKKTAPFSIGIGTKDRFLKWAFQEGDPYEVDVPLYIKNRDKHDKLVDAKFQGYSIPYLYFGDEKLGFHQKRCQAPTHEIIEKLNLVYDRNKVTSIGFSLDKNEFIYLYKKTYRIEKTKNGFKYVEESVENEMLTDLYGCFGGIIEVEE